MKAMLDFFAKKESIIIYSFIFLFFLAASIVSVERYYQFENFYFDFGIFDRALWLAAHFRAPLVFHPNFGGIERIIFADHFNPSMFLLAPFYWVTDRREVFLIVQSLVVSVSAFVAYKISKDFTKNTFIRIGLICCYLLFVGLQNALISDIHDATLATLPLVVSFWAIQKKKWLLYWVMVFIILGFKESFAGLITGIGIYLLWLKNYKIGILTICTGLLWLFTVTHYIIPYFSHQDYFYSSASNASFSFIRLLTPFIKVKTLFLSFLSFGFLPLFYPPLLPAIFENFFERFSTLSPTRWDLGLHYSAVLAPLFFISSLHVVRYVQVHKSTKRLLPLLGIALILISFGLHRFILHGPLGLAYNPTFYSQTSHSQYLEEFVSKIPTHGLIMTQNDIAVRLTHCHVTLLDTNFVTIKPNAIALNLTSGQNPNVYFPASPEIAVKIKDRLLQDKDYSLKKYGDELYLFTKK